MSNKRKLKGKSRPSKNKAGRNLERKVLRRQLTKAKQADNFPWFKRLVAKLRAME